jgi:hypothetical protein
MSVLQDGANNMTESIGRTTTVNLSEKVAIQFYSIELMPLFDGRLSVGVMATLCDDDGEFDGMDLGSHRVASLDEALAVIRHAIAA